MNNLSYKLNKLSRKYKQTGGGGIPFSALQQGGKKTIRGKTRRSPSRKRRVSKKTSRRTKRRSNRNKIKRTSSKNKKKCSCGSHTYTSNENTPRGAGNCEECIPLNVVLKGKDGKLYENKNNHWVSFN
jgi:hypothetical protein